MNKVAGIGGRAKGVPKIRLTAALLVMALEELVDGPSTRADLIERTGLHWATVNWLVAELHKKGLIHIVAWDRDARGAAQIQVFQFGRKKDAPKPPPLKDAERMRLWREKKARKDALRASAGVPMQVGA